MRDGLETVEGIPVQWVAADAPRGVALWLTHLGGSAEQAAPMLTRLAERGLLAVSFDPPGHGRRGTGGDPWELASEVLAGAALRFRAALRDRHPRSADRVRVELYEDLDHLDAARDERLYLAALDWLAPQGHRRSRTA